MKGGHKPANSLTLRTDRRLLSWSILRAFSGQKVLRPSVPHLEHSVDPEGPVFGLAHLVVKRELLGETPASCIPTSPTLCSSVMADFRNSLLFDSLGRGQRPMTMSMALSQKTPIPGSRTISPQERPLYPPAGGPGRPGKPRCSARQPDPASCNVLSSAHPPPAGPIGSTSAPSRRHTGILDAATSSATYRGRHTSQGHLVPSRTPKPLILSPTSGWLSRYFLSRNRTSSADEEPNRSTEWRNSPYCMRWPWPSQSPGSTYPGWVRMSEASSDLLKTRENRPFATVKQLAPDLSPLAAAAASIRTSW